VYQTAARFVTCSIVLGFVMCAVTGSDRVLGQERSKDNTMSATNNCKERLRVFIDVGHYRTAPGATSARGKPEFEFNVKLAQTVYHTLVSAGYKEIKLFISKGGAKSLEERAKASAMFRSDVFLSIHHDDVQSQYKREWTVGSKRRLYSDEFGGFSLFVSKINPFWQESLRLAQLISNELLQRGMSFTKHHAELINGESRKWLDEERGIYQYDELIVLKDNAAPAILFEAGVIVNRAEETALSSPERQLLISDAIADAIDKYCVTRQVQ
jgi:N-acetylmuramoyl-L-alanine amidase